jgi:hypothetical protein
MITFEPDSPWEVGQVVIFRDGDEPPYRKVVIAVEHSDDGTETQYRLENPVGQLAGLSVYASEAMP